MSNTLTPPGAVMPGPTGPTPGASNALPDTYGSFWIGELEFAIAAMDIQEVVPFPSKVVRVPLAPSYVIGLFDLRGEVVPVVCVATLLGLEQPELSEGTARVAIIDCGADRIGAVFSRTGALIRTEPANVQPLHHGAGEDSPVIGSLLRLEGGARIVQVVTAELIAQVAHIPRGQSRSRDDEEVAPKVRMVVARVGVHEVAFDAEMVIEIQEGLTITETVPYFEHFGGVVTLRGETVGVLDMGSAFGHPGSQGGVHIFVHDNKSVVALAVDAVVDVVEVAEDDVRGVPMLERLASGSFCKKVAHLPVGYAVVVDVPRLFEFSSVSRSIPENPDALSRLRPEAQEEAEVQDGLAYLNFCVGNQRYGLPLDFIREIQDFPTQYLHPPSASADVIGMMDLRGEIISLVDLRVRCGDGMTSGGPSAETKVLVVEEHAIGYVVDGLAGIIRATAKSLLDAGGGLGGGGASFVKGVLSVPGEGPVMAIDPEQLIAMDLEGGGGFGMGMGGPTAMMDTFSTGGEAAVPGGAPDISAMSDEDFFGDAF